jgi:hypothetical protein
MPKPFHVPPNPLRSRMTERPQQVARTPAKAISRVDPSVVAPIAVDPMVLVALHDDRRLSLATLVSAHGVPLARSWAVARVATGYLELIPSADVEKGGLEAVGIDGRHRLRLGAGLTYRLAVPAGGQVLVTAALDGSALRVLNPGTFADLIEAATAKEAL